MRAIMASLIRALLLGVSLFGPVLFAAAQLAQAETYDDSRVAAVLGGAQATTDNSPIVELRIRLSAGSEFCSGSLIGPRTVLTAAHCMEDDPTSVAVVVAGQRIPARRWRSHPRYSGSFFIRRRLKNDVAIVTLRRDAAVTPLPLLATGTTAIGDAVTVAGYGYDERGLYGVLREGTAEISALTPTHLDLEYVVGMSSICSGDSGGPLLKGALFPDTGLLDSQPSRAIIGVASTLRARNAKLVCKEGAVASFVDISNPAELRFILANAPDAIVFQ